MKFTLHESKKVKKISFDIQAKRLKDAIQNCELGAGTLADPITADGFVTINDHELDTFHAGETIKLKLKNSKKHPNFRLVCCKLGNVGKQFNSGGMTPLNPWAGIFIVAKQKDVLQLPDNSLCLIPKKNTCKISIPKGGNDGDTLLNYISYSIIFSYTLPDATNDLLNTCFFVLDPIIRVSSNPPK